jgi:Tfp pilus assembly protein FimT
MRRTRAGYTVIEMVMAFTVAATGVAMSVPKVSYAVSHMRVNQAASVAAADLELAASLAERQRTPVRLTINPAARTVSVTDRASGAVLAKRAFGLNTEYNLTVLASLPAAVDLYPNGTTSQPIVLALGINGYTRIVTMTRAGQVRVIIP